MKLNVALIILFITNVLAVDDDAKEGGELEVKSAQKEDAAENTESDVSRKAEEPESYTVPVEVIKDAVTESEVVRIAVTEGQKEDSRVERATASAVEERSSLKPEDDKLTSESEHITSRRSNDATTKAVTDDEASIKAGESDDEKERTAKPEAVAKEDDVLKKGEDGDETVEPLVRSAVDEVVDVLEKSAVETKSTLDDGVKGLERAAKVDDVTSLVEEGVEDLADNLNLNTRRMLNPILQTILDTKARQGEKGVDEGLLKSAADDASEAAERLNSFDSLRTSQGQTILPPLMPLPNKQNFFLTPALPAQITRFGLPSQAPSLPSRQNPAGTRPFQMNFLHSSEHKPFNGLNSHPFQYPRSFSPSPASNLRPSHPQLPFGNLPSFDELFKKALDDSKSNENLNFQNNRFNRRVPVPYGAVPYLQYKLN